MNDEQIKEVMRRADDYAFIASCETERNADSDPGCDEEREETCSSRAALKAYLRTIGEPAQSVNAELLDAAKSVLANVERFHSASAEEDGFRGWQTGRGVGIGDALQDSIDALKLVVSESAIETPAKVSPCAGHAVQQDADLRQIVGIKEAIAGIAEFFDAEWHSGITKIVDASKVRGQRVEDECRPTFDHCYVTQGGGGFSGDDFHGTAYFHIGNGEYATVDY